MRNLLLSACCLLAGPAALAATMASQPWVTNRIAEAVAAIPQPGNYATVSNRAMSALQSHQSLQPSTNYTDAAIAAFATTGTVDRAHTAHSASTAEGAMSATWAGRLSSGGSVGTDNFTYEDIVNGFTAGTNYTDAALGSFAATGAVARAATYGTPTRWTDATGCVWRVTNVDTDWHVTTNGIPYKTLTWNGTYWADDNTQLSYYDGSWLFTGNWIDGLYHGSADTPSFTVDTYIMSYGSFVEAEVGFSRDYQTNLVGRVALTSDMPYLATNANGAVVLDRQLSFVSAGENGRTVVQVGGDSESDSPTLLVGVENPLEYGGAISVRGLGGRNITIGGGSGISPNNAIYYNGTNIIPLVFGAVSVDAVDAKISTNNAAFVSAVLAAPLVGADASDLAELSEYGSYGTVGAALLALIAGLAALKRRVTSAETALAQKADADALPYALVTPGEWEFSDEASHALTLLNPTEGVWIYYYDSGSSTAYSQQFFSQSSAELALSLTFDTGVTATRASLPGHLCDRAVNAVPVSTDTELTLPALVNAGKARDFLVRLEISGSTVPSITFQGQGSEAPNGADEITYETDGDEFPVPDESGTWLYSFTETAAHTFAVALKSVSVVTQGGV